MIGILQAKGGAGFQDLDDQVFVPIGVVQKYFVGGDTVRTIGVSVTDPDGMTAASAEITALLRDRHELAAGRHRRLQRLQPDPAARGGVVDQRDA